MENNWKNHVISVAVISLDDGLSTTYREVPTILTFVSYTRDSVLEYGGKVANLSGLVKMLLKDRANTAVATKIEWEATEKVVKGEIRVDRFNFTFIPNVNGGDI